MSSDAATEPVPPGAVPTAAPDPSWQHYRLLANPTTDVVYEIGADGTIAWISPAVTGLLGWRPDQLQGRPARDLIHPLDLERTDALRAAFYRDGVEHDDVTCMACTASGGYREVRLRTRPLFDAHRTIIGATVTVTDTHDRDSALRALTTLSRANRTLVRATDEATLLQQMCETIVDAGATCSPGTAGPWTTPTSPCSRSPSPVTIRATSTRSGCRGATTRSGADRRGAASARARRRWPTTSGPIRTTSPGSTPPPRRGFHSSVVLPIIVGDDLDGVLMVYAAEVGAFDALAQDLLEDLAADLGYGIGRLRAVRERDAAVLLLSDSEQRFRLLAENASDVILLSTADMTVTWVSPSVEQAFGYRVDEIMGRNAGFLIHPDDRAAVQAEVQRTDADKSNLHVRHRLVQASGHTIWVDVAAGHIDDDGTGSPGRVVSIRDVDAEVLATQELTAREAQYRLLAENASDVILLSDQNTRLTWVSASSRQTLGWDPDELLGHTAMEFIHPDDHSSLHADVARSTITGEIIRPQYRWRRPDGTYRWMEGAGQPIPDDGSGRPGRVVSLRDIDAQRRAEDELAAREGRYRLLAENASDVVWQVGPDGRLVWTSPSVTRVLGWTPDEVLGTVAMDLVHADDRVRATERRRDVLAGNPFQGEFRILRADGEPLWMALTVHPVPTPTGLNRILSLRDIHDEVGARSQLEFALGHDRTTGLPGREGMVDRIAYAQSLLGKKEVLAVLCVGVDALGEVNEALSHGAGDIVLRTVAARVAKSSPSPELVGRGAGDEFIVVVPAMEDAADAAAIAEDIRLSVHGMLDIADHAISPTVSIGIAIGDASADPDALLRDAALALRQAKGAGRDRFAFVDSTMAVDAEHRLALEGEIRDGLRNGEFVPWYQPITSLADGRVDGFEALARWVRPDGLIEPAGFITVAAHTGLLTDIDLAMVEPVVAALAELPESVFIAVNVSGKTLARAVYAELVASTLASYGVSPSRLHIEVTETMLLALDDEVVRQMHDLASLGCRWYVDDFGTGYSSISHLRDLPVAGLKLDMSFTSGIGAGDRTSMQLAGALIGLANGLGLDTVAEGVETQAEADYLRTLGWRHGQGWLFGRAAPTPGL